MNLEQQVNKLTYAHKKIAKEDILFARLILVPESSHRVSCKQELGL